MVFAAISTAIGESGIGIVRMSGEDSFQVVRKIFTGNIPEDFHRRMLYGKIVADGVEVDEVLLCMMQSPKTYTTENMAEIYCHGGIVAVRKVYETVLRAGARPAEPGEFTKAAFLGGRLDLSQAEAVADLIHAKTDRSYQASLLQLSGGLSEKVKELTALILEMLANVEATIDFPEEDLQAMNLHEFERRLEDVTERLQKLLETEERGRLLRDGLMTVILGKPNVGKSSLMNALLGENRSIVTSVPGTTRDSIEEFISLDGIPIKLIDTAGIRETEDEVEKIGVDRAKKFVKNADLLIGMFDLSEPFLPEDEEILQLLKQRKSIVIFNKTDLGRDFSSEILSRFEGMPTIRASVKEERGLTELAAILKEMFFSGEVEVGSELVISNLRHRDLLHRAKEELNSVRSDLESGVPIDFMEVALRSAWSILSEITGESVSEDVIDKIFKEFCLGK